MATGDTGFSDVAFDLISVQYHALKAGHDYGTYVRDAEDAGQEDIAAFFRSVMAENSERARTCHRFLARLAREHEAGPATDGAAGADGAGPGGAGPDGRPADGSPLIAGREGHRRAADAA